MQQEVWSTAENIRVPWLEVNSRPLRYKTNALTTEPKSRLSYAVIRDWLHSKSYAKSTWCRLGRREMSRHDWKIVDWNVKLKHATKQANKLTNLHDTLLSTDIVLKYIDTYIPIRIAQSVTRLTTDGCLTADQGVASSITARSFRGDWSCNNFDGHSPTFRWLKKSCFQ